MSYVDAIDSLASDIALPVTRRQESARVNGREQAPTTSSFTIVASVQSPTGKDVERNPEGKNVQDLRVVFTKTVELFAGTPGSGYLPDLITIDGGDHEVEHCEPWKGFGKRYWRAVVRRKYAV